MTYSDLESELKDLPQTWYPALIKVIVEAALAKEVEQKATITFDL